MSHKPAKIKVERKTDFCKIFINGILHIQFKVEELYAIQSWMEGKEIFHIKLYLKSGPMKCYYYDEKLWKAILDEINKISLV